MIQLSEVFLTEERRTMTVYHGTTKVFDRPTEFKAMKGLDFGPGFYFATEQEDTTTFGPIAYRAEIVLERPFDITNDPDPAVLQRLQKAMRIKDEDLTAQTEDGTNPYVALMELAKVLIEIGEVSAANLMKFMHTKLGFDGVHVHNDVIRRGRMAEGTRGDFVTVFTPQQILKWERVK